MTVLCALGLFAVYQIRVKLLQKSSIFIITCVVGEMTRIVVI